MYVIYEHCIDRVRMKLIVKKNAVPYSAVTKYVTATLLGIR